MFFILLCKSTDTMKVLLLFAFCAVANCYLVPNPYNNLLYTPRLPKINGKVIGEPAPYIVGGQVAQPHSIPYQAALYIHIGDALYFCGGSVLSNQWVFTAAHCTIGASSVDLILGAHDLNVAEGTQFRVSSTGGNIHTHEAYDPNAGNNDMSLLFTDNPIPFTNEIQPVALPQFGEPDLGGGFNVVISGWGGTDDEGGSSSQLKVATVVTITNDECAAYYGSIGVDTICTSYTDTQSGTCFGDSGGPLTLDSGSGPVHRAVTSFVSGAGCMSGGPDGFTRTNHFRDWINQVSGL